MRHQRGGGHGGSRESNATPLNITRAQLDAAEKQADEIYRRLDFDTVIMRRVNALPAVSVQKHKNAINTLLLDLGCEIVDSLGLSSKVKQDAINLMSASLRLANAVANSKISGRIPVSAARRIAADYLESNAKYRQISPEAITVPGVAESLDETAGNFRRFIKTIEHNRGEDQLLANQDFHQAFLEPALDINRRVVVHLLKDKYPLSDALHVRVRRRLRECLTACNQER